MVPTLVYFPVGARRKKDQPDQRKKKLCIVFSILATIGALAAVAGVTFHFVMPIIKNGASA